MIVRLFIQNYALIDRLEVAFAPGMNLLTGETGAGKSILVGAIGLVLGERADASVMLDQQQKCVVEAELQGPFAENVRTILTGESLGSGEDLLLRREISPGGRSRAFINDTPVTLEILRAITQELIDLHGQHEGQALLEPAVQISVLDQFAGTSQLATQFGQQLKELLGAHTELADLKAKQAEASRQLDFLNFQLEELEGARLSVEEDEQLEQEIRIQQHAEQIAAGLGRFSAIIYDDEHAVVTALDGVLRDGDKLGALDARIGPELQMIAEARHLLEDAARRLARLAEETELDPARLAELEERQSIYNKLKMKYQRQTVAELLALQDELSAQRAALTGADERINELVVLVANQATALTRAGLELELQRVVAAKELSSKIEAALHSIGLAKAAFEIEVARIKHAEGILTVDEERVQPARTGLNSISFRIRTNAGVPMGSLASIASGGEVSRVMLAIKSALAEKLALGTLIFDEIDTGISGEVALRVGRLMQKLATRHQLLTITHLPQIASRPGRHFFLYKEEVGGRAATRLRVLSEADRQAEIAKMMSGENPSATALQSAAELLAEAAAN